MRSEGLSTPWLKHELPQLEAALESVPEKERKKLKPVLIVGAGLSAADAVTICRSSGIKVIHVYRNRTAGLDKMLPENVYPEYHEVRLFFLIFICFGLFSIDDCLFEIVCNLFSWNFSNHIILPVKIITCLFLNSRLFQ